METDTPTHEVEQNVGATSLSPVANKTDEAAPTTPPMNDHSAGEHEQTEQEENTPPAMDVTTQTPVNGTIPKESPDPTDQPTIDGLLITAERLYAGSCKKERELLMERIEIGEIFIRLKDGVGHRNFMKEYKKWQEEGKVNFSLKTAQRAMAYATLKAQGYIDNVSNLTEAEKIRKTEAAKAKAKKKEADRQEGAEDESDELAAVKLTTPQIGIKARQLVKPALDGCQGYASETRILLIEELIEILTEELEQCS